MWVGEREREREGSHTFPTHMGRHHPVHLILAHLRRHLHVLAVERLDPRLVHPALHEEGPADEGDDGAKEGGRRVHLCRVVLRCAVLDPLQLTCGLFYLALVDRSK